MDDVRHHSSLPKKYTQVVNYGKVISNNDPMNLGRIRVEPVAWQNEDQYTAFKDPFGKTLTEKSFWTINDPFVYMPLLPLFIYQVPKVGEYVHVIYYNTELQDRNKFYIQGNFSNPNNTKFEPYDSSLAFTAKGERNSLPNNIRTNNGEYINVDQIGLYPDVNTIGLLGRYNSDIFLPENGVALRANTILDGSDQLNPTFNKKHSSISLQKYETRNIDNGTSTYFENNKVVQPVKYLIEYNVYGGIGTLVGRYSANAFVYKISEYQPVYTNSVDKGWYEFPEISKIGPIYKEDYTFKTFDEIVTGINNLIQKVNSGKFLVGNTLITDIFPFVFQPEKPLYDKYSLNNVSDVSEAINAQRFISAVHLNKTDANVGFGLVCKQGELGPLTELTSFEIENITAEPNPITYGINVSDISFLLSHDSQIPGTNKIDFDTADFSGNTLSQKFIEESILPNTNSMVRGEQLLNLIELIVKYLITHVHPYHGMAPNSVGLDGTQSQKILAELFNATETILNKNLRINWYLFIMSIHKSYLSKNNTIIYNSTTNTGLNPVTELFFGRADNVLSTPGYSRFIFDIDLSQLQQKISDGVVYTGSPMTHKLKMTNTIMFNYELLNTTTSDNRRRATAFDLSVFDIPKLNYTGSSQTWNEGVGYDYYDNNTQNTSNSSLTSRNYRDNDKSYSNRPSNWYGRDLINNWSTPGIYNNDNSGTGTTINYSGLTQRGLQHFEFGNENLEIDISTVINSLLTGNTTTTGWVLSFSPQLENLTGLTENYSVGFFTRHTQTFYEPYLETTYDDLILDDRTAFFENKVNKLYLYSYINGTPTNFDFNPKVNIEDSNGDLIPSLTGLTTVRRTEGVYECTVPALTGYSTPCQFSDIWSGVTVNGVSLGNITNDIILRPASEYYQIGPLAKDPVLYGFEFSGIKQDEKILNTDTRKVVVTIKQAYTSNVIYPNFKAYYRLYVKEGTTEVIVQDWTRINQTPNEYYFIFDTKDKIPNEYYVDIKVLTSGEVDTYKRQLKFQIVNQKWKI